MSRGMAPAFLGLLAISGCAALERGLMVSVQGAPLSGRPPSGGFTLSTGGSTRAYRTLGFAQVLGYGVSIAGVLDLGKASIDTSIQDGLVTAAREMGGDGVLFIEFHDTNPQTPVDRMNDAAGSVSAAASGNPREVKRQNRKVYVTGQIVKFEGP